MNVCWTNKRCIAGLPWWFSGWEPSYPCRRVQSLKFEKIPQATGQLSLCTATAGATHSRACALQQEKPPQWEAWVPPLESSPSSLQLEKARVQQWRPSTTKDKSMNIKKKKDVLLKIPLAHDSHHMVSGMRAGANHRLGELLSLICLTFVLLAFLRSPFYLSKEKRKESWLKQPYFCYLGCYFCPHFPALPWV